MPLPLMSHNGAHAGGQSSQIRLAHVVAKLLCSYARCGIRPRKENVVPASYTSGISSRGGVSKCAAEDKSLEWDVSGHDIHDVFSRQALRDELEALLLRNNRRQHRRPHHHFHKHLDLPKRAAEPRAGTPGPISAVPYPIRIFVSTMHRSTACCGRGRIRIWRRGGGRSRAR
jgi:hypothetical protein